MRLLKLQRRLANGRALLADQLVLGYKADRPDVVSVVLGSTSFADLLDRFEFLKRVQNSNARVIDDVRDARDETHDQTVRLGEARDPAPGPTEAVRRRHAAIAAIEAGLAQRQGALQTARAARAAALQGARADRIAAQNTLDKLIAERERAAVSMVGPGGPWAIPWAIVQCESGGQNLPPNWAGASGYYQFMPATWRGLGGSTPHAYQAPKAEQDRLAARLWNGGAARATGSAPGSSDLHRPRRRAGARRGDRVREPARVDRGAHGRHQLLQVGEVVQRDDPRAGRLAQPEQVVQVGARVARPRRPPHGQPSHSGSSASR